MPSTICSYCSNLQLRILPVVRTTSFKTAICCSGYRWRKYLNDWLAVQNLRTAFFKVQNSFFPSYLKRVTGTNSFSQSSQRVMTEGFLKPNAKTAFFKAILKPNILNACGAAERCDPKFFCILTLLHSFPKLLISMTPT